VAVDAIRGFGQVDAHWSEWFDGLMISNGQPDRRACKAEL
jgi:hypothetical protein